MFGNRCAWCCAQIVSRTGKLAYEWAGLQQLPQLLDRLVADQVGQTPSHVSLFGVHRCPPLQALA